MSHVLSYITSAFNCQQFSPVKLQGYEEINQLYIYHFIVKTSDSTDLAANVDLTSWIGQNVTVGIELDGKSIQKNILNEFHVRDFWSEHVGQGTRYISGYISQAQFLYNEGRSSYYTITLEPWLAKARLQSDYKIFQNVNVFDIFKTIFDAYAGSVSYRIVTPEDQQIYRFPKRDYQCQFGETSFDFFARLSSEWGLNWWFEHTASGHQLIIADDNSAHKTCISEAYHQVCYYPPNHKTTEEYLHEFNLCAKQVSGAFVLNDYSYTSPAAKLLQQEEKLHVYPEAKGKNTQSDRPTALAQHQIYAYAADTVQPKAGAMQEENDPIKENPLRAKWNLERLQQGHFTAQAKGYIRGLEVGRIFRLTNHPSDVANRDWRICGSELLVVDISVESQRRQLTDHLPSNDLKDVLGILDQLTQTGQQWHIESNLKLMPANVVMRPPHIDKPKSALQTAIVVGEAIDSVHTDEYGRIKVQFHWDRYGEKNTDSSCWIRVNQAWAGGQMGAAFIPRVGQEVLIDFINADPDLPICIGKVHNQSNQMPWQLTQNQALSGFRSRELGDSQAGNSVSGRSNHLVFDDSEAHIQTQLTSDHAYTSLSLGDITRIESNKGRKDARGLGFELRTDDWGSIRGGKGLYISTYEREKARSTTMDADEAVKLIDQAQDLGRLLSDRAYSHRAESLKGINYLNNFISQTLSIKKNRVGTIEEIATEAQTDKKTSTTETPTGFSEACMVMASPKGIAITTPEEIYSYAQRDTVIVSGQNLNLATGKSLQASVGETFSMFVQDDAKFFAGKGKIQVQAHNNNIELVADKTLKVISNEDKVEIAADKEILIACGGAYIRLKGGNIDIHAPGKVEVRGQTDILSPTSMRPTLFSFPEQKPLEPYVQQFVLLDQESKKPVQNMMYQVTDLDGNVVAEGRTNEQGETQLVDSEYIPQTFTLKLKEEEETKYV